MDLKRQRDLAAQFYTWFDGGLKKTITDNRRRYRMELLDAKDRIDRGLSVLPSTKSTSIVDTAVERALKEYHQDPEAMSYTAKARGNIKKELECRWLTEIIRYRSRRTFRFYTWHKKSLKAGFTDGIEACMLSWRHATREKKSTIYSFTDTYGVKTQIDKATYDAFSSVSPGYSTEIVKTKIPVRDTWWIDQLMPGRDILWDPKAPMLDLEMGQFVIVKLSLSLQEVKNQQANGIFNSVSEEKLIRYQNIGIKQDSDTGTTAVNPENIDLSDLNHLEVWAFFDCEANEWGVQFSLEGKEPLSTRKPVNDVFFNGRDVNCLPVIIGYSDDELWENIGRGLPKIIAPLEDEASDHRNNYNDYAKQLLNGKHWVDPSSDVDVEQLINRPVVLGKEGVDFGQVSLPNGSLEVLRATDNIDTSINSLVPVELATAGRSVVPKGNNATLGTVQIAQSQSDDKLSVRIMTRNETFMYRVLYVIAQLEFAWETDETIARHAASKVNEPQKQGGDSQSPQFQIPMDGTVVDFRQLDFDFDIQINAGLGSVSQQQKGMALQQISEWRKANGVPTDVIAISRQLNVLAGFDADAFTPSQTPPPPSPPVNYSATISIDLTQLLSLAPEAGNFLLKKMLDGEMAIDAKISDKAQGQLNLAQQNGGGLMMADRTGNSVSGTDMAAQRMSQGGMHSPGERGA